MKRQVRPRKKLAGTITGLMECPQVGDRALCSSVRHKVLGAGEMTLKSDAVLAKAIRDAIDELSRAIDEAMAAGLTVKTCLTGTTWNYGLLCSKGIEITRPI